MKGTCRMQQPSPVEVEQTPSNRPDYTGLELHSDNSTSSTPRKPPFKTYLPFNSEGSRNGEQDLLGIDTRLSTSPPADWTTTAIRPSHLEESSFSSRSIVNEETPLLQGADLPSPSVTDTSVVGVALDVEQGANEDGNTWQDDHQGFEMPEDPQQSIQVDEFFTHGGRHCEGKPHPEGRTAGLTGLITGLMKALFPCAASRGNNRPD